MKKIENLYDLLLKQLRDLYDGNIRQLEFLDGLAEKPNSPDLQTDIDHYIRETTKQKNRLEQVFTLLNEEAEEETCQGIKAMLHESKKLVNRCTTAEVCDAALITAIQHINHYEIAGYGTAIAYAKALDNHEIAAILLDSLRECKNADSELSDLAIKQVNIEAK